MPQRRVPSSQALLGPPPAHVDCKDGPCDEDAQGHADEEDGFRWGRKHHFVEQCVVLGSVCVDAVRCLKFKVGCPARYGSVRGPPDMSPSDGLRVAAGLNRPGSTSMGVLISKENGVCELAKAAAAARRASRGARAASGAIIA